VGVDAQPAAKAIAIVMKMTVEALDCVRIILLD
jgi:hypothetical protein